MFSTQLLIDVNINIYYIYIPFEMYVLDSKVDNENQSRQESLVKHLITAWTNYWLYVHLDFMHVL